MSKILLFLYVLTTSLGLVSLKLGSKAGAPITLVDNKLHYNLTFYALGGFVLYGLSFFIYTFLIAKYDLGYIIPLATAFVYIVIFIASYFIFKETFTAVKILGIALILGGVILLNLKK